MSKIKRRRPAKLILIPDTSNLYSENRIACASRDFSIFWEDNSDKFEIELILPEVVIGELLYHHTSSVEVTIIRINEQFINISKYADKKYKHNLNLQRVQNEIKAKFDIWISKLPADIVETPVDQINWKRVVQDAIWRRPPFIKHPDRRIEKGFRDALILETVVFIANSRPNMNIAFVCKDKALRSAAKDRLEEKNHCSVYETFDELSSLLRQLDEKITNEFLEAIQERAEQKFFSFNDESCLFIKENIHNKIRKSYKREFASKVAIMSLLSIDQLGTPFSNNENWEEASNEKIDISAPKFLERLENYYTWDSLIKYSQEFRYIGPVESIMLEHLFPTRNKLRLIKFKVIWKTHIAEDGEFSEMNFVEIKPLETKYKIVS